MTGRLLTAFEVAEQLGYSPETVRRWTRSGELPGYRIGGRLRYPEDEVEQWVQERATTERGVSRTPQAAALAVT